MPEMIKQKLQSEIIICGPVDAHYSVMTSPECTGNGLSSLSHKVLLDSPSSGNVNILSLGTEFSKILGTQTEISG